MHPESERERRALIDRIEEFEELIAFANRCPDWPVAAEDLSRFVRRHEAVILAALRQPTAEPDTAGREAGADGWRTMESAPREPDYYAELPGDALSGFGYATSVETGDVLFQLWWKQIAPGYSETTHWRPLPDPPRSLPLHPEGSDRTMGGDDGQ